MQAINWLELKPQQTDLDALHERIHQALPARKVRQLLAEITLQTYPWAGRSDLIPFFHPSQTYQKGQWVALPIPDAQKLRPLIWQVGQVTHAETVANSIQGKFQAITLDVYGKQIHVAAGILLVHFPDPELYEYNPAELEWLSAWVADTYAAPIQDVLCKLTKLGQLTGQFVGDTFLPERVIAL